MADHPSAVRAEATDEAPVFAPPTDILETKDAVIMVLDMPGADTGTLSITLDNRVLNVSARSAPSAPEGYTLVRAEYRDGNYERRFTLTEQIDRDRVDAVLKDGVLRLTLPKAVPSPAKTIEVKTA
jgi:HSP20 family protein